MSVARHLHTSQSRSEVDVAAAAIVAILDARIVPKTSGMIGRLSMATGVLVADIKRAWELKEAGYRPPLPTRRPMVEADQLKAPEPRYAPNYTGNIKTANERARAKKEPVPGKRKCNRCGELKDVDQFQIMNPRTRKRRPECKACNATWRRERYLSSQKMAKLGPVLRFILEFSDSARD